MKKSDIVYLTACALFVSIVSLAQEVDFPPNAVVPSDEQIKYQQMEVIGFVHFGVNTFTDREWGTGDENPEIFNPTELNTLQWVRSAKQAGMGMLILTAKHHDGFCLWPSAYTDHSVKGSPWRNGKGDVVRELYRACQLAEIKFGVYLSPWDMHEPKYGTDQYNQYYLSQLEELMTNYGTISEVWMDGAKGQNAKDMEYDFEAYRSLIYELQPTALIFSDAGPDIRWIGNEHGIAHETNWSMLNNDDIEIGKADTKYLNTGDPEGKAWLVGECDVSIRPGWFYHSSQDDKVKTPQELVDLYYKSVGRNGTLLLNIPPDKRGLWHENDVASLAEFRSIIDETFQKNLAENSLVIASSLWSKEREYSPLNLIDNDPETFWAAAEGEKKGYLIFNLGKEVEFDRIMLQEPIRYGQRVSSFIVEAFLDGEWNTIAEGTTVGHKRLLRTDVYKTNKIRIQVLEANNVPALSGFGIFKASDRE